MQTILTPVFKLTKIYAGAGFYRRVLRLSWLLSLILLTACQRGEITVHVLVDHGEITHRTNAQTVRNVLTEVGVVLDPADRVEPDLYTQITPEMRIQVIRVTETTETETIVIPFERKTVVNEALPLNEKRLAQLGVNGEETVVTKIVFENGVEVSRAEISRSVTRPPVEELLVIGGKGELATVYFEGAIAYLSGGNAWVMRGNNAARRPVTTEGDLDGRAFSLSADGSRLLYSRTVTEVITAPLNELWLVNTRIVGEKPISLPVQGVLYAEFSPLITDTRIAYSTAERVPSRPGWRANNDLYLWDITTSISQAIEIVPPNTTGFYPWWGTNFKWSPDGALIAYANANEIGVIDVVSHTVESRQSFAPYRTNSEWVWVPTVSWSPDSRFLAAVLHGRPAETQNAETSETFDLWLIAADGTLKVAVQDQIGMWGNPVWHAGGIAFGQAVTPEQSATSRYKLATIDWDGSNMTVLFPRAEEPGTNFPEMAWLPGETAMVFVNRNNLYLLASPNSSAQPLTADDQSGRPLWHNTAPAIITPATTLTETTTITPAETLTATAPITLNRLSITQTTTASATTVITAQREISRENTTD